VSADDFVLPGQIVADIDVLGSWSAVKPRQRLSGDDNHSSTSENRKLPTNELGAKRRPGFWTDLGKPSSTVYLDQWRLRRANRPLRFAPNRELVQDLTAA
jgi:hypothetical protein